MLLAAALGAGCSSSSDSSRTCAEIECGDFGKCSGDADGGPACICDVGYTGEDCSDCADGFARDGDECVPAETGTGCSGDPCNGNGECDESSGEVQCTCDEGYTGDDCADCADGYHDEDGSCVEDETCGPNSCPPNATCDDSSGAIECPCNDGFTGEDCDECSAGQHLEGDECVDDENCMASTCAGAGTCDDSEGTPVCECDEGYTGANCDECAPGYHEDAGQCLVDEECGADSCPPNAECDDTDGIVVCACVSPYTGEDCTECEDPLVLDDTGECVEEVVCEEGYELGETGVCVLEVPDCDPGYQLIDLSEVDVSELDLPEDYFPNGVPETGYICIPADTTCADANPCSQYGTCDDSGDGIVCICDEGYAGLLCTECAAGYHEDGAICVPDETCLQATCNSRGTCDDSTGEIDCTCDSGYDGLNCDECAEDYFTAPDGSCVPYELCDTSSCNGSGACAIVDGLASCTCFQGYTGEFCDECAGGYHLDGDACVPDVTCGPNSCSGAGDCVDTSGVVECTCDPGYSGDSCQNCAPDYIRSNGFCVLIDNGNECNNDTCNGNGECDDSTGVAVCTCVAPTAGIACQSCIPGYIKFPDGICRVSRCGDGIYDPQTEECDDGTLAQEDCTYGLTSCTVCGGSSPTPLTPPTIPTGPQAQGLQPEPYPTADYCTFVPGYTNYCGDYTLDNAALQVLQGSIEECDVGDFNENGYGGCADNCTFNPYCGDGVQDVSAEEACDDGRPDGCDYFVTLENNSAYSDFLGDCSAGNADDCTNECQPNVCGDTFLNVFGQVPEECEDTVPADCTTEGPDCAAENRDECLTTCEHNECGDGFVYNPYECSGELNICEEPEVQSRLTSGAPTEFEWCDGGEGLNTDAPQDCEYGTTNCAFCSTSCDPFAGNPNFCGDGNTDSADGEFCDDGAGNFAEPRDCDYGEDNCAFCEVDNCAFFAGTPNYCGDGNVDTGNGEDCDEGAGNFAEPRDCDYGDDNCSFCSSATCVLFDGEFNDCGDGNLDVGNGEVCDSLGDVGCPDGSECIESCSLCSSIIQ